METVAFQSEVYAYYQKSARVLPWRSQPTPYNVFISEVMLQQTQVPRVIEKFNEFIALFPDFPSLAQASIPQLLKAWSGLGYNRRALLLKRAAETIVQEHQGTLPSTLQDLQELPGIGPATAASISAFAFNRPVIFIETNIRSVFIHSFFPNKERVSDAQLLPLIEQTLDYDNPRKWYSALMDYGSMLKKIHGNPNKKSKHYTKQSKFEGSDRQIRGAILKVLLKQPKLAIREIYQQLPYDKERIHRQLHALHKEGFLSYNKDSIEVQ